MGANRKSLMGLLAVVLLGVTASCSGGSGGKGGENTGTLAVALTGTTPNGTSYHLTNAVFEITNFYVEPTIDIVVSGDDPTLQVPLPPSVSPYGNDYTIDLEDGWTLNAVNPDGSETPLSATLLQNFIPFTIKPQRVTPITFPFKASELVPTTGNGAAGVNVAVDDTLIDDFEDGTGQIAPLGGRNGGWFTFNDGTGTQTPAPGTPVLPVILDTSANYLLRTTGSGFDFLGTTLPDGTTAYGAGVGTTLLNGSSGALPYDASSYSGVTFDISLQSTSPYYLIVSFLVATSATTPVEFGGTCTSGCGDDFGFVGYFFNSPYLYSYSFPWSNLTQQGFGTPVAFDPSTILSIKWIVQFPTPYYYPPPSPALNNYDLRLDNIAFLPGANAVVLGAPFDGGPTPTDGGPTPTDGGPTPTDAGIAPDGASAGPLLLVDGGASLPFWPPGK
jgi:hypothetical protein